MVQAEITMIPQNYVELTSDEDKKMFQRIMDLLDEDDDVQVVFTNADKGEQFFPIGKGYGADIGFFQQDPCELSAIFLIKAFVQYSHRTLCYF